METLKPNTLLLCEKGACKSRAEARALIRNGGVVVDGERVSDPEFLVSIYAEIRAGKRVL